MLKCSLLFLKKQNTFEPEQGPAETLCSLRGVAMTSSAMNYVIVAVPLANNVFHTWALVASSWDVNRTVPALLVEARKSCLFGSVYFHGMCSSSACCCPTPQVTPWLSIWDSTQWSKPNHLTMFRCSDWQISNPLFAPAMSAGMTRARNSGP